MTVFRGLAFLIALFLLAPKDHAMAQAEAPAQAELERLQPVRLPGQCPRLCVEWYDGCNVCTCGKGKLDVCTQAVCRQVRRRPRCLRWGF
jgi:hypothetical protein